MSEPDCQVWSEGTAVLKQGWTVDTLMAQLHLLDGMVTRELRAYTSTMEMAVAGFWLPHHNCKSPIA